MDGNWPAPPSRRRRLPDGKHCYRIMGKSGLRQSELAPLADLSIVASLTKERARISNRSLGAGAEVIKGYANPGFALVIAGRHQTSSQRIFNCPIRWSPRDRKLIRGSRRQPHGPNATGVRGG